MRNVLRNRSQVFFLVCASVALYLVATFVINAIDQHRLADDRREAEQELAQLQDTKERLEGARRYAASDRFVEIEARKMGLVKPNEVPFVIESPALPAPAEKPGTWWERLLPR